MRSPFIPSKAENTYNHCVALTVSLIFTGGGVTPWEIIFSPSIHTKSVGFPNKASTIRSSTPTFNARVVSPKRDKTFCTSALESNVGLNAIAQWCATRCPVMPQGLGTGLLFTDNIDSPLAMKGEKLWFNL